MSTQAEQAQKTKNQPVASAISQEQSGSDSSLQFIDNRPEAVAQRKLQAMADNSQRSIQLKSFQGIVNNSPHTKQTTQLQKMADNRSTQRVPIQKKQNNTGLPDNLKSGIENLSGTSLDDVQVHRNSDAPAQLNAHAYAQGTDIHLGPGQEKHLPHEAWHVVQQKQGRVKPTTQLKGDVNINEDQGLEEEADIMGQKALQLSPFRDSQEPLRDGNNTSRLNTAQLEELESTGSITTHLAWGLVKGILAKEMAGAGLSSIISPLLRAGDTFLVNQVTSLSGLAAWVPGINALITSCKAALAIWDTIPDNVKTGLLYVMGIISANAPILNRFNALQGFIIKSDEGEVRTTVQGWVNTASSTVGYLTQPLSSLYSWLTGSTEQVDMPEDDEEPSPTETEKLINLNLQVITLMVNNLKLGYDKQPEKSADNEEESTSEKTDQASQGNPGLIVEFFVQLHLFGQDIPDRGEQVGDQLFFPFAGEFKYIAGSSIIINAKDRSILGNTLGPISIFPLEVSKSGVKKAGLNISKLIIGNGIVILTDAEGQLNNKLLKLKTDAQVNIAQQPIRGAMELQFNDGSFKSLKLTEVESGGKFKLNKFSIDNNYTGEADVEMEKMELIENTLSATKVAASGTVENKVLKTFNFSMDNLSLDAFGSSVSVTGAHLKYVGADPENDLEEKITGGASEIDANIDAGIKINMKGLDIDKSLGKYEFSSGTITFKDFSIEVKKASIKGGGIEISQAVLSIPEYDIKGEVNGFTWTSEGLDFESLTMALPGKTINPIEQLQLSNMSLTLTKGGGYAVTVTSDITVSPSGGSPVVGATGAQLKMSKEEISGTLAQLKVSTSMFDVLIKDAEFSKDKIGAAEAGISFKSSDEDSGYASIIPSFDTGLLDYINLSSSLKATDVYFNKGQGFSVGSVYPMVKAFSINLFGVEATVDPEDRSISIKSSFTFPGNMPPVWPFSLSIPFPIIIGVAGHFGLELGGGVTLDFDAKASKEKGKDQPYKFEAHPGIKGDLYLKISAGVELGARLAVALQANLYAQASVAINTKADLTGSLIYADSRIEAKDPLKMLYELKNIITAEVGGELKLKAFMFYDKQLTRVKFKDWNLGEWSKSGEFGSSPDGKKTEDKKDGKFGSIPTGPDMDQEIVEGKEAQSLLLEAKTRIIGSGAKRKEILSGLTMDVKTLSSQLLQKHQILKREFDTHMDQLMKIILRKDVYFRQNIDVDGIQAKLDAFDSKHKLDEKRELIRSEGGRLDDYEEELNKILGLMNNVEAGLDVVGLEEGTGTDHQKITEKKEQAKEIQENMNTLKAPESTFESMNSELERMGASALTVSVSTSIMTRAKFIEISTTKGLMGGENERKRVKSVDSALNQYDSIRNGTKEEQIPVLENLLVKVREYATLSFSSRTEASLLLQYQVEHALNKLKKS